MKKYNISPSSTFGGSRRRTPKPFKSNLDKELFMQIVIFAYTYLESHGRLRCSLEEWMKHFDEAFHNPSKIPYYGTSKELFLLFIALTDYSIIVKYKQLASMVCKHFWRANKELINGKSLNTYNSGTQIYWRHEKIIDDFIDQVLKRFNLPINKLPRDNKN